MCSLCLTGWFQIGFASFLFLWNFLAGALRLLPVDMLGVLTIVIGDHRNWIRNPARASRTLYYRNNSVFFLILVRCKRICSRRRRIWIGTFSAFPLFVIFSISIWGCLVRWLIQPHIVVFVIDLTWHQQRWMHRLGTRARFTNALKTKIHCISLNIVNFSQSRFMARKHV